MRLSKPLLPMMMIATLVAATLAACSGRVVIRANARPARTTVTTKPAAKVVVRVKARPSQAKVVVHALPEAPDSDRTPPPAYDAFWVGGHYAWDASIGAYRWVAGQWAARRPGKVWVEGNYREETTGGHTVHAWVSGRWVTAEPPAANAKPEVRPAPKPPEAPKAEAKVKTIKPPRAKRDKRTPMPAARAFWVPGHWTWDRADARYVWLDGRWVIEKPGMRWEDGAYHWVQLDDVRVVVWRSGHWVEVAEREPEPPPAVTVHELPDPPVGRRPARTGRADFWVDGHWEFDTSSVDYGWIAGEWKAPRAGHRRVGGRYEWATQGANRYRRWVPGAWLAVSTPRPDPTVATATPKPAPRVSRIEPPPAPRSRRPRQPSRTSFWIDGHWDWDRSLDGYRWTLGRWEQARRDARWVGGSYRWSRLDEARMVKTWLRGHWERLPAAEVATAPADVPAEVPPEPAAEVRAPRPSDAAVWLDGHFDWTPEDSRYVWTPGAWETPPEPDSQRVSGHYQWLVDNGRLVQAWREGTWSKEHAEQAAEAAEAPAGEEPPAAEPDEPESARPDATAFWVAGHWTWDPKDARYVWEGGRWIDPIEGESWIYGAYEWDKRNGKLVRIWQDGYFAPPSAISRPTPTQ